MAGINVGVGGAGGAVANSILPPSEFNHFPDGGANNADSFHRWSAGDDIFYNEIEPQAAAQYLDVVFSFDLPTGFTGLDDPSIEFEAKNTIGGSVTMEEVVDSFGASQTSGFPAFSITASKTTFTVPLASLTGTFSADTRVSIRLRGTGGVGETIHIGQMRLKLA